MSADCSDENIETNGMRGKSTDCSDADKETNGMKGKSSDVRDDKKLSNTRTNEMKGKFEDCNNEMNKRNDVASMLEINKDINGCVTIEECDESVNQLEISSSKLREKMDSGSALCLMRSTEFLSNVMTPEEKDRLRCVSFNGSTSISGNTGYNQDGVLCHEIHNMPEDLILLAASVYSEKGAVVLFPDKGFVITGSESMKKEFRDTVEKQDIFLNLKVVRGTYEVCRELVERGVTDTKLIPGGGGDEFVDSVFDSCGVTYFNGLNGYKV